jgi:hypothetical protein
MAISPDRGGFVFVLTPFAHLTKGFLKSKNNSRKRGIAARNVGLKGDETLARSITAAASFQAYPAVSPFLPSTDAHSHHLGRHLPAAADRSCPAPRARHRGARTASMQGSPQLDVKQHGGPFVQ